MLLEIIEMSVVAICKALRIVEIMMFLILAQPHAIQIPCQNRHALSAQPERQQLQAGWSGLSSCDSG